MTRFSFRYDPWCGWLLGLLGSGRRFSHIDVDDQQVVVQMGYGFLATLERSAITSTRPWSGPVWGWGAHGWRGRWLVNGSSHGLVVLTIDPAARAKVLFVPIKLRELVVSLEQPDEFIAALSGR